MRSLYNKIVKNNQVTYGPPFQIRITPRMQNIISVENESEDEVTENVDSGPKTIDPEELLEQVRHEAELILKEAGFEADRLLEQARQEAEKKAEAIAEEAWQRGYAEGTEAARQQNESILAEAEEIRLSASEEHDSIMAGMETEIVELLLDVARKVVSSEITTNRDVILHLVKEAMDNCSGKTGAVLRLSPTDCDYLEENRDALLTMTQGADSLEIKRDSTLKQGDCIIETSMGCVDAGVGTRMDKIGEAFREQLEGK